MIPRTLIPLRLQLHLRLDPLSAFLRLLLPARQLAQHLFMLSRILQALVPSQAHSVVPRLHQAPDQLAVGQVGDAARQLALIALPHALAHRHPLQHLPELRGLALLDLQQLLVRALGWVLLQAVQIGCPRQREHVANRHGHKRAAVVPRKAQHVVAAKVHAGGEDLHLEALLLQHHGAVVHDPELVPGLVLPGGAVLREEGVALAVEGEQIPELPVEGLEERQVQQPSGHREVQVLHDHGAEELPLLREVIQDPRRLSALLKVLTFSGLVKNV